MPKKMHLRFHRPHIVLMFTRPYFKHRREITLRLLLGSFEDSLGLIAAAAAAAAAEVC